jgi:hypothetical protein
MTTTTTRRAYTLDGHPVNIEQLISENLERFEADDVAAMLDLEPGQEIIVVGRAIRFVLRRLE